MSPQFLGAGESANCTRLRYPGSEFDARAETGHLGVHGPKSLVHILQPYSFRLNRGGVGSKDAGVSTYVEPVERG